MQSCQNKLLKHFLSMQITVTSTHVEGFDPVSCGLLFWKEIEKKFLHHSSFCGFPSKPFVIKIVSLETESLTRSANQNLTLFRLGGGGFSNPPSGEIVITPTPKEL